MAAQALICAGTQHSASFKAHQTLCAACCPAGSPGLQGKSPHWGTIGFLSEQPRCCWIWPLFYLVLFAHQLFSYTHNSAKPSLQGEQVTGKQVALGFPKHELRQTSFLQKVLGPRYSVVAVMGRLAKLLCGVLNY